jgi:hypothetical protein
MMLPDSFRPSRLELLKLTYTVIKGYHFSRPQPGCHLPNSPWPGIIKLFPARESLVSDIPARDGKIIDLFLQCILYLLFLDPRYTFSCEEPQIECTVVDI